MNNPKIAETSDSALSIIGLSDRCTREAAGQSTEMENGDGRLRGTKRGHRYLPYLCIGMMTTQVFRRDERNTSEIPSLEFFVYVCYNTTQYVVDSSAKVDVSVQAEP